MASAVTLKDEIQHGATHAAKLTWLQQFSAAVRSRFPSKKLQVGWRVTTATDTEAERLYIEDEVGKLFHKNKNVSKDFSKFLLVF